MENNKLNEISFKLHDYKSFKESMNEGFLKDVVKQVGEYFGDFAVVFRGYTPSFNDGDEISHYGDVFIADLSYNSYDFEDEGFEELFEWFEVELNEETDEFSDKSINSNILESVKFKDFELIVKLLNDIVEDIYRTNYLIKIKVKDKNVELIVDGYSCDY